MTGWDGANFGTAVRALARVVEPERPALIHGDWVVSWPEMDRASDGLAAGFLAGGLQRGDVVGLQLRNSPDFMITFFACVKAGLIPINVNFHYRDVELADILRRFGVRAVVQNSEFALILKGALALGAKVDHVFEVEAPTFKLLRDYESAGLPAIDDNACFYVATGGTTGMPKAVIWRHIDAWAAFQISSWPRATGEPPMVATSLNDQAVLAAANKPPSASPTSPVLVLSPLMHGAGLFAALMCLMRGGTLVTLPGIGFDAGLAIDTIARRGVVAVSFVGDAFALPIADEMEARSDASPKIASWRVVTSSGAMFSSQAKSRLLAANPGLVIVDALGSSEAGGTAISVTTAAGTIGGEGFSAVPGRSTKVFDDDLRELPSGSKAYGILARAGPLPLGYLGEDDLSARVFPTIDGVRYLLTGDRARIGTDGRIEFAGRDNLCINTGGEKVFPEEVEAVLQAHPSVLDVRVVGLPDPRFGSRIAAVVQGNGSPELERELDAHVRAALSAFKVPRVYAFTDQSLRLNNGKPDYKTALQIAEAGVGAS